MKQSITTFFDIILHDVHIIDGRHRYEGVAFVLQLVFPIAFADHIEFTTQYFSQKVAIAACWFEETAVDTLGLLLNQIQHGVDLTLVGKYFTVLFYTFF
ncbi:hypothetical protein HMPREF3196_02163 [Bifidobacterium bifidum]|uniref:Uncharacterized protein n=1 Tax=Bifidobacterium bifidum TaxID=1681 RepID=A0A133KJX8_BIFBI|nr:hypothetical protein HMPREF3196_02163 [Bifidobacterium bifidum]